MPGKIIIIDAGGTISAVKGDDGAFRHAGGIGRTLALVPAELRDRCEVRHAGSGLSENLSLADVRRTVAMIAGATAQDDVAGVVVTHGTDAMEEGAFMARLLLHTQKPVVFTGAQRTFDKTDYDGVANLRDSIMVVASGDAVGAGVLVVFGGIVLPAALAAKRHSSELQAFGPRGDAVGSVQDGSLMLHARPCAVGELQCAVPCGDVELMAIGVATSASTFERLAAPPTRAVVIQAMGRGNMPGPVVQAVRHSLARDVLVAVASGSAGGTGTEYGSAFDLHEAGAWFAGQLTARKARIVLACALGDGRTAAQARQWIAAAEAFLTS